MKKIFKKLKKYFDISNNDLFVCFPSDATEEEIAEIKKLISEFKK